MREITRDMLKIYKPISNLDWLNYKITHKNDMTAHHIIKRENGGSLCQDNIALLLRCSHEYLHIIEYKDIKTYITLNKIFKIINQQETEPTKEQREIIEYLLLEFESKHIQDRNSKGKLILKKEYLERGVF